MAFYMKMGSKSHKASGVNMNGTPLKKCGDPGEPPCTQPSQATADAAAEKSVDNANRVYNDDFKETGRTKVPGGTEVSFSRNYNQTGTGEATKSYTQLAKEGGDVEAARKWNAERSKSGTETKTRMITDPIRINPAGFDLPSMQPEANLQLVPPTVPKEDPKPKPGPGGSVSGRGRKKITLKKPKISLPLGSGSSKGSGCPGGKKNCGAVNK